MVKASAAARLWSRLLQLRISTCAFYILAIITVVQFFSYGVYDYSAISTNSLNRELLSETAINLIHHKGKPACNYDEIISRKHSLNSWEVSSFLEGFTPAGIMNGTYVPTECNPKISVAILVTYRNRQKQLDLFLPYMHNFLRKQNIHYKIYLIEQQDEKPWNKGLLYNLGAKHAMADKFPCLILHDVDLLPLNDANLYACLLAGPRHMSASIDKFRFVLPYSWLVGGVLAIRSDHYVAVNGFSNRYEQWGGEDDDFYQRLTDEGLPVLRLPRQISEYHMESHAPEPQNPAVWDLLAESKLKGKEGRTQDGLNGVAYSTLSVIPHRLFTLIGVKL